MGARNRSVGWVVASAGVGLMMLAVTGCAHDPKASNLEPPAIVWVGGEPTGPEWDTEWAQAFS